MAALISDIVIRQADTRLLLADGLLGYADATIGGVVRLNDLRILSTPAGRRVRCPSRPLNARCDTCRRPCPMAAAVCPRCGESRQPQRPRYLPLVEVSCLSLRQALAAAVLAEWDRIATARTHQRAAS